MNFRLMFVTLDWKGPHVDIDCCRLTKDNWNVERLVIVSLVEGKQRVPLKLAASETDLCVCKKKSFYFYSENQRGYLTDFSICNFNRVDETKDTKDFFL